MKIYFAARNRDASRMRAWAKYLRQRGFVVTSRWISRAPAGETAAERAAVAAEDVLDLYAADVVILHNPSTYELQGRGGRHFECGYACALGKPVIVVGAATNVFHHLPQMTVVGSIDEAVLVLGSVAPRQ